MPEELSPEVGTESATSDLGSGSDIAATEQVEATDTQQDVVADSDTPRYTVTVDGQEIEVGEDELRNGYMRQADYTRKTQEAAAERARLAAAERIMTALRENPQETLEYLRGELVGDGDDDGEVEDLDPIEAMQREIESLKEERQREKSLGDINAEVARLKRDFGEFDENKLFEFAIERQIGNLEDALVLQRARSGQAKPTATAAKENLPPIEGGSNAVGSSAPKTNPRPSFGEAMRETLRELGVKSISDILP